MRCRDRSRSARATAAVGNALGVVPNSGAAQCALVCPRSPLDVSVGRRGARRSEGKGGILRHNCTPNERG